MLTGFVIGIALFYETGFIILIPLVFTIAQAARLPVLYVGMPLVAALITTHGFLPPHPGPTAIANVFQANMGQTLLVGIILAIPAVLVGGLLFTKLFKKISCTHISQRTYLIQRNSQKKKCLASALAFSLLFCLYYL